MYAEGNIGVCGIAVLTNFSCGISVILISKCDIAVFSATLRNAVFQHFGLYSNYSPCLPMFPEPFPASD